MAEHATGGGYPAGDVTVSELRPPLAAAASPPLTNAQMRYFLERCAAVVKPGETLVIRLQETPAGLRAVQEALDAMELPFRVLVVPGDDLGVVQDGGDAAFARRVAKATTDLAMRARFPRRPLG